MNSDYFLNTRDYYLDLVNEGKKFYKDFAKFLRNNIQEVDDLRKLLDAKKIIATMVYQFWYYTYNIDPSNVINRIKYIHSLLEYRRILIMFDLLYGYQPPKFQKLTGDDLKIVKPLAKGELDGIIQGRSRLPHVLL
jgi:SNF2 family DNA or RNA helicase